MNQQPQEDWNSNPESLTFKDKLTRVFTNPQTQIISFVTLTSVLAGGYMGSRYLAKTVIPSRIETELEKMLARDISLGNVSSLFFNGMVIDDIKIFPTVNDPSFLSIDSAKISLDLWSLIVDRKLPIKIIASDIKGYAQLDTLLPPSEERKPLPDSLKLPPLPIDTVINLQLQNSEIGIASNSKTKPLEISSKGKIRLDYDRENQPLTYEIENQIGISRINIEGKTLLSNTASENEVEIRFLNLPQIASLIPFFPLNLQEGNLNSNVRIATPSLQVTPTIEGKINLQDVKGKIDWWNLSHNPYIKEWKLTETINKIKKNPLSQKNFISDIFMEIGENSLNIESARLNFGGIDTLLKGEISQTQGYNLQANINPFSLGKVLPSLTPLPIDGLLTANLQVTGDFANPQLQGRVKINKTLIDRIDLGNVNTLFTANLDKININEVTIKPVEGGLISSQGIINTNFRQTEKPLSLEKIPFNFQFKADLPSNSWINQYINLAEELSIVQILATGEVKGNLSQPQGKINFSSKIEGERLGKIVTKGRLGIDKENINIDTQVTANENNLTLIGNGNWQQKTYEGRIVSEEIRLTPFLSPLCKIVSSCEESIINVNLPIKAENLAINFQGNLSNIKGENKSNKNDKPLIANILSNITTEGKVNLVIDNYTIPSSVNTYLSQTNDSRLNNAVVSTNQEKEWRLPVSPSRQDNLNNSVASTNQEKEGRLPVSPSIDRKLDNVIASTNQQTKARLPVSPSIDRKLDNVIASTNQQTRGRFPVSPSHQDNLNNVVVSTNQQTRGRLPVSPSHQDNLNNVVVSTNQQTRGKLPVSSSLKNSLNNAVTPTRQQKMSNSSQGRIALTFNLSQGDFSLKGNISDISVNNIFPSLMMTSNIIDSELTLQGNIQDLWIASSFPDSFVFSAKSRLEIQEGLINAVTKVDREMLEVTANINPLSLSFFTNASLPLTIDSTQVNITANTLELFSLITSSSQDNKQGNNIREDLSSLSISSFPLFNTLKVTADVKGKLADASFNSLASINNNRISIDSTVNGISSFSLPNTNLTANNLRGNFSLDGEVSELISASLHYFATDNFLPLSTITMKGSLKGNLQGGDFYSLATINSNRISIDSTVNGISSFSLPNTNLTANNIRGNFSLDGNLSELISFSANYISQQDKEKTQKASLFSLPNLKMTIKGKGDIKEGEVSLATIIQDNQWQGKINTSNLNLNTVSQQLGLIKATSLPDLNNVNSNIYLTGSLPSLLQGKSSSINIDTLHIEAGKNKVTGKGSFNLVNGFSSPDINNLQLNLTANTNLNLIPVNQLLSSVGKKYQEGVSFLPTAVDLQGKANFQGILQGNNLLTNPLANNSLAIQGNLTLSNLRLNQMAFESFLQGKVNINPSQKIAIDLRGKEDVIAVSLRRKDVTLPAVAITLPFFPDSLEIKQGGNKGFSLVGNKVDNSFNLALSNFALETLQWQPAINFGFKGNVKGVFSSQVAINLSNLTAKGNINIDNPAFGNILANNISSEFHFADNIARLDNGKLSFANSNYDLQGKVNVATQEVEGRLAFNGRVEDIFATLNITDVATVSGLLTQWQSGDFFSSANSIPPQSVGDENNSIKSQVNLLSIIDQQIKSIAQRMQSGTIPDDLDIRGKYQGEILLAGKLPNPEIDVNFEGNQWQWLPQRNFPNIVDSLGLVMEETQFIPIDKVAIKASWQNNNLLLQPFELNIANSKIFFAGNLSATSQEGNLKISQFPLSFLSNFSSFPRNLDSLITVNTTLKNNLFNPQMTGDVTLNNISLNGAILEQNLQGKFDYNNYQLNFETIDNQNIAFNAQIPYHPLIPYDNPALINVKIDKNNSNLLEAISFGKVALNSGNIVSNLTLEINSINELINSADLSLISLGGEINFEEATVSTTKVNTPIKLNGKVNINKEKQAIQVEELLAKINDANINIFGNLPLINSNKNEENPLTVSISDQRIEVQQLYSGGVNGDIVINGTALKPEIGGYLALNNGNFFLPSETNLSQPQNNNISNQWLGNQTTNQGIVQPQLKDFTLKLDNSELSQWGLYRFLFAGNLTLNGGVSNWQNLKADGTINLRRGQIYLGSQTPLNLIGANTSIGQTTFFLSRTNENTIVFNEDDSILNPDIDIEVVADIVDYSRQLPNTQRNEILEPIVRGGRGENIQVVLRIDGGLAQLLPVLSNNVNNYCRIPSDTPIAKEVKLSSSQLNEVAECINLAALNQDTTNANLLNSPLVSLSSIPQRSEGELVNLIVGGQLLNLATQLQDLSGQDLFENGLVQFILVPLANNVSFGVNEKVSTWGKPLGMKDVRVFPLVEGVYEVQEDSNVTVSYDYIYGEFKVRYQMRF